MKSKNKIRQFQEFLMNSWPANHYYFLNGWILRFTEGVTSRANSVFPVQYTGTQKTLEKDITFVENAYKAHKLNSVFTMPELHEPKNLKSKLMGRGYHIYDQTSALGIKLDEIQIKKVNEEFNYYFHNSRVKEISDFLVKFSKRNEREQRIIQNINERIIIPKKCYMTVSSHDKTIGTLFAVLIPQGYLYIGDLFVHPDYRKQDIATSMLVKLIKEWAILNEVKYIWLQVEINNIKAQNLYHKFGMKKLYNYYYMSNS